MQAISLSIDEKLIRMVQNHKFLYDRKQEFYKNCEIKESTWIRIADELNCPAEYVKKRWDDLLDGFIRAYCEYQKHTDQGKSNETQEFPYYEIMNWLVPYIRKRRTIFAKPLLSIPSMFYNEEENYIGSDFSATDIENEFEEKVGIKVESAEKSRLKERIGNEKSSQSSYTKSFFESVVKTKHETMENSNKTADELFMQSISLEMAVLPQRHRIEFKIEILKLLQAYLHKLQ